MKKITDSFELNDDVFFRSVFLYDHQERLIPKQGVKYKLKNDLPDVFVFGDSDEENLRKMKYVKFFEAMASMLLVMKFIDSEKNTPKTFDLLKFYWAEKLNLDIKNTKIVDSSDYKKMKIKLLYEYVCEKQLEILFKLDWKFQTISVCHFLDHYKRLLPDVQNFNFNKLNLVSTPKSIVLSPGTSDQNSEIVNQILNFRQMTTDRNERMT
jgi:hypothetical protein